MRPARVAFVVSLLLFAVACGAPPLAKPPQVDPTEQWVQAGKKVDFAITETKVMIQRARGADYLPDLYMRLAELYTERARYAWLVVYERSRARGDDSRALEVPEARVLKNLAIGTYTRILREFPTYARADEALFLTGHEYRELGDFDKMTESYEKLIDQYPKSPHRLEAYLTLGDHAFDANDLATAERRYNQILAAPPSAVHPLARYKLAWVRVNQQDCAGAVRLFEATLKDRGAGDTTGLSAALLRTQKNVNVTHEALVDLAYCYPDVYPDKPAIPYFRGLASSSVDYLAAMRRLAGRFVIKEMPAQAAAAMREVLDGAPGSEDSVEVARRLHASIVKGSVFDKAGEDVNRFVTVLDARLGDYRLAGAPRERLLAEFEALVRDIATRAHVAAKESQSTAALSQVGDAYDAYLSRFGKSAAADEVRENRAEALLGAKRYFDAGRANEDIEATTKKPATRVQARLNAVAAYQQALDNPALGRLDRVVAWGGIRALGLRVIADAPNDPAIPGIKLSIARSDYETGEYEKAAELFYAVARQYPTTKEGVAAAHLSLDSLRLADDLEGLTTLGKRLVADLRISEDVRKELGEIVSKAAQRQVAEMTVSDSSDRLDQLLAMAKRHKGSELGEEAFYNTLLLARSNGEIGRFYELGDEYLTDYPTSKRRIDVLGALATVATDSADFANAGKYLSAAYAADPQGKEASDRLYAAASIHAVLGDAAAAAEIGKLVERGAGKVDDLLLVLARSGNITTLEQVLAGPVSGPTATFFRGYVAFKHKDFATARATLSKLSGASPDLVGRANFLMGEMAYAEFRGLPAGGPDIAATIDANVKGLAGVDKAFKPVIEGGDARWAMAGLARLADTNAKFAAVLRGIEFPASLPEKDKEQLKTALGAQAAEADKRSNDLRAACVKQAKKHQIFSEAAKSCLLGQPLPDTIPMYAAARTRAASDPPGAALLRKALLKNAKDGAALVKLAELELGAGDVGVALLLLERADQNGARKAAVKNLMGLTYNQLSEAQLAADAFQDAVTAEPGDTRARLNLAAHCAAFGQLDRARTELRKAGGQVGPGGGTLDYPDRQPLSALADGKGQGK
jgi:tetratricopeptide (TPR) repeat protein/Tfp pilus assembly protein PilF